jgi:hypothetical protein
LRKTRRAEPIDRQTGGQTGGQTDGHLSRHPGVPAVRRSGVPASQWPPALPVRVTEQPPTRPDRCRQPRGRTPTDRPAPDRLPDTFIRGSPMYAHSPYPDTRKTRETRQTRDTKDTRQPGAHRRFGEPGGIRAVREAAPAFGRGCAASPAPAPPLSRSSSPVSSSPISPAPSPLSSSPASRSQDPAPGRVWWYVLYEELGRRDAAIDALAERVDMLEDRRARRERLPPRERRRYYE